MNTINGFCSAMKSSIAVMSDAGAQGLGFDVNRDGTCISEGSFCLSGASWVRAVADPVRSGGDLVAVYEHSNPNEGLPPIATLECSRPGALLRALEKVSNIEGTDWSAHTVMRNILSFLEPRDVTKATGDLPSGWGSYQIDDLFWRTYFPLSDSRFSVIDKKVWVKCFGKKALDAQGLIFRDPPFIQGINDLRERVRSFKKLDAIRVENNAGFKLLTIPEGLTLNKLIALAAAPQEHHQKAVINYIYGLIAAQYGDALVEGGVVAISNGLLTGSRYQSVANQRALLESQGCQMPRVVDVVALYFLTYINSSTTATSPVCLLSDAPGGYASCVEQITCYGTPRNLFVGGFVRGGLDVDLKSPDYGDDGVVALRKF